MAISIIREYLHPTANRLKPVCGEDSLREAQLILSFLLNISPSALFLAEKPLSFSQKEKLEEIIQERLSGRPLQYVLGETEFMSLPFKVTPAVLIPRGDTERVVEAAIDLLKENPSPCAADICCGSGAIGISLAHYLPKSKCWATDISAAALAVAAENAAQNGVKERISFLEGDLFAPLREEGIKDLDLVISNPPYIAEAEMPFLQEEVKREPYIALVGGKDGLDFYRRIANEAAEFLAPNGVLILETGYDQEESVGELLSSAGWKIEKKIRDYGANHRGFVARR